MNSNWFKFFVASQINCKLKCLRCYYAKELKKTKSSKKVYLESMTFTHQNGHTLHLREQIYSKTIDQHIGNLHSTVLSNLINSLFVHVHIFIVINLFYPTARTRVRLWINNSSIHREYPLSLDLSCFLPDLINQRRYPGD